MNRRKNTLADPKVVFDFGNVIIDIDYQRCYKNFCTLLGVDWNGVIPKEVKTWIVELESGNITEETFLWKFQTSYNSQLNPRDIIDCWNSMLTGIPEGRLDALAEITKKYDSYLLSNTNSIHLSWVRSHLEDVHKCKDFDTRYFQKTFYSHEIGMVKPNAEIYAHITEEIGCRPEEILFIDDLQENVDAAKDYGWAAVLHDPVKGLEQSFSGYVAGLR